MMFRMAGAGEVCISRAEISQIYFADGCFIPAHKPLHSRKTHLKSQNPLPIMVYEAS